MFAISAMMQAKSEEQLEPFTTSFIEIFPVFVAYFKSIWLERKTLQEKAWRPVSTLCSFLSAIYILLTFCLEGVVSYEQHD